MIGIQKRREGVAEALQIKRYGEVTISFCFDIALQIFKLRMIHSKFYIVNDNKMIYVTMYMYNDKGTKPKKNAKVVAVVVVILIHQ